MLNDFAVFILTNGRSDRVFTVDTLRKCGYTGEIYIIIDDEDPEGEEYKKRYGGNVISFNKEESAKHFDLGDTTKDRRVVVFARNMCHKIAQDLGLKNFLVLDDDYSSFEFRYIQGKKLMVTKCKQLDRLFQAMVKFLHDSNALVIAFSQGGDFIGGAKNQIIQKKITRKVMNSFFCRTDKPFKFVGWINEDTNTYVSLGNKGHLMMSITDVSVVQKSTQSNAGGLTTAYLDTGTYRKSFYSVMFCPSCVKVGVMGDKHMRMHHHVDWRRCVPKILNEQYRKE